MFISKSFKELFFIAFFSKADAKVRTFFEPPKLFEVFFEKFLLKSLVVRNKVLTFASAFENDSHKEEFFERFRYEQASSTILT